MTDRRIDLTESQLRGLVLTAWKEAFSEGRACDFMFSHSLKTPEQAWDASLTKAALEQLIALEETSLK